jgi:hypothetical protein
MNIKFNLITFRGLRGKDLMFRSFSIFGLCGLMLLILVSKVMGQQTKLTLAQEKVGIRLEAESVPLINLLLAIQEKSGIRFDLPESLDTTPITHHSLEPDWKSLVSNLLKGFTKVDVWSDEPGKSYVKIVGIGNYVPPSPKVARALVQPKTEIQVKTDPKAIAQARKQSVASQKMKVELLPPHILMDPAVITFLKSQGVQLPEHMMGMFGQNLEGMPKGRPILPHILNDPVFIHFLDSKGIQRPKG